MSIGSDRKGIDEVLDIYRNQLDNIPDDLFDVTPPGGGWSYAEVYSHIMQANLGSTIALEKCTLSSCKPTTLGRTPVGLFVLTFGRFPPVKLKAPEVISSKVNKISKEDAKNLLVKCRKRINDVTPLIYNSPKNGKIKHPRLGMLNAKQWFKFILIHSKHHLRQLDRIEKKFQTP